MALPATKLDQTKEASLSETLMSVLKEHEGRDSAITAKHLARMLGTNERTIRQLVADLRAEGKLIASTVYEPCGFFVPATRAEADECSRHLWSRVRKIAEIARQFDQSAQKIGISRTRAEQIALVLPPDDEDSQ